MNIERGSMENKNIVTLFVRNDEGDMLLQKRSKQKGGKYGFISGHVQEGETNSQGIIRETKEEMGINIDEKDLKLFYRVEEGQTNFNLYYMNRNLNIENLTLQKEEVEDAKWCSVEEIKAIIDEDKLYKNHIDAFEIAINYLNSNKI